MGAGEAAGCCCVSKNSQVSKFVFKQQDQTKKNKWAQVFSEPEMNWRTIHSPERVQSLSRHNEIQSCPGKVTSFFGEDLSTETIYCLFKRGWKHRPTRRRYNIPHVEWGYHGRVPLLESQFSAAVPYASLRDLLFKFPYISPWKGCC